MHSPFRTTRIVAAFAVAGVLLAGAALARPQAGALFDRLDTDRNGSVSHEELAAHKARRSEGLDANADGVVSFEEVQAQRQRHREERARARFARLDRDGDGEVSVAEFEARGERLFEKLDADGDGEVSREEFRAAHRGHRRGHHDGQGDAG